MILLVRGDLRSESGWSRATRALVAAIADQFTAILGIDLHHHPIRELGRFPYPIVDSNTVATYTPLMTNLVALHACQPDRIELMPGAINVGWWFWETDRIQADFDWKERLETLDILFVPSDWHATWVKALGIRTTVVVLPWPFEVSETSVPAPAEAISTYRLLNRQGLLKYSQLMASHQNENKQKAETLREHAEQFLLDTSRNYAISVQSDAPRKGLACLLSEWQTYRAQGGKIDTLLIRFSGLDIGHDAYTLLATISRIALGAARGDETVFKNVRVMVKHLPDGTLRTAYTNAQAMVTPTFGEGFGGTIVEATRAGSIVVVPRHTACGQLLPTDYPLAYTSTPYVGSLVGQFHLIPCDSTWHMPTPGAIADRLLYLDKMSDQTKSDVLHSLRSHMKAFLAPDRVKLIFFQVLDQVQQQRRAV